MSPTNLKAGPKAKLGSHTNWKFPGKMENEALVLHAIYPEVHVDIYQQMVRDTINLIVSLVRNHGYTDGPKRYGIIKDYTISLIEGREPVNPGWISTSEVNRVPSKLGCETIQFVVNYINQRDHSAMRDDRQYQVIITLLNIVRKVKGLRDADYKSVTEPSKPIKEDLLVEFETYVSNKLKPHVYKQSRLNLSRYPVSIKKKGPNGVPKIESAHAEAKELLKSTLRHPFRRICVYLGIEYLYQYLVDLSLVPLEEEPDRIETNSPKKDVGTRLRVIVPIPDSGFKTRLVAISDFWSQLVLEPIREHVQVTIETLYGRTDFRLDQQAGVTSMVKLQKLCVEGETIKGHKFSIENLGFLDASSWTDRFHRDLQKIVMRNLFSPFLAEAWAQLTVHCDWYAPKLSRTIKYGQGQGMGTNGSFDIATLTDHLLINMIIDRDSVFSDINQNHIPLYGKVGDDLYVYNYQDFLKIYEDINLPINLSKSKVSCKLGSIAEFCSRTFVNCQDVSRISPGIISKTKDFKYFPLLISLCHSRGIVLTRSLFPQLLKKSKVTEESYLEKLQPYLLGLFAISQMEPSSYVSGFNLQQMIEEEWFVNDEYINVISDQRKIARLVISHSIVTISDTMSHLQDKIFELVDGMEEYGDEVVEQVTVLTELFNTSSEGTQYLLTGPFIGQNVLLPKQIIVLARYVNQRFLIRQELDKVLERAPDTPAGFLQYVKDIAKICHRSCYDGGSLSYDTEKIQKISWSVTKTLARLDKDFTTLSLPDDNLRNVYTYIDYDRILKLWPEDLPYVVTEEP